MKKKTVIPRKKRGPPATGHGEPVVVRMHPPQLEALDRWIAHQPQPFPTRPEAVRRLVERGLQAWVEDQLKANPAAWASSDLTVKARPKQPSPGRAAKANEMAGKQLDQLADQSASPEEQASRKRKLLKGPEEFREARVDRAKK